MENYLELWESKNKANAIIFDGYGVGVECLDRCRCVRLSVYDDKTVAYDYPEIIPQYVKNKVNSLVKRGVIVDGRCVNLKEL